SEAWFKLNDAIGANANKLKNLDTQIKITNIQFISQQEKEREEAQKKRIDAEKKAAEDAKKRREEQLRAEKEARAAGFADFKAQVELELLAAEEGSEEQLEIRKRLARAELQIQLDNEKLTENQRKLL